MTRLLRTIASLLLALLITLSTAAGAPTVASAADPDPVQPGAQYLGACVQSASTLSVLVLFDKSGSLNDTDGNGVRYRGLETLLGQLARLSRPDGRTLSVEVAVAAFDHQYYPARSIINWTRINQDAATRRQLIDRLLGKARQGSSSVSGGATDFQAALEGGLHDLADRTAPSNCRVLVWFTDGEFTEAANGVDAARSAMCTPGGLLDALRRQRIVIVGLQLGTDASDLKPMSLGTGHGRTCGTYPLPEGQPPGVYLNATDDAALAAIFGQLGRIIQGCTDAGPSGVIDPGIRRMVITSPIGGAISSVRLQPPDGPAFDAPASGSATHAGGYSTQGSSDDSQLTLEVTFPSGKGAGRWGVGSTKAVSPHYCVFADLTLRPDANQSVAATPKAQLLLQVVDRAGQAAALGDFPTATVAASVVGPDKKPRVATASSTPQGRVTLTFDALPSDARVDYTVTLNLKTASGLDLPAVVLNSAQALTLSDDYPIVTPRDRLDLGDAVKRNPAQKDLTLVGSPKGSTQVCLGTVQDLQVPADAQGTRLDYPAGCVDLGTSETKHVTVSSTPLVTTTGDGSATIPVTLVPVATSQTGKADFGLPVTWRFTDPFNPWVAIITTIVVAALSVLVPLLAIGVANWAAARYDVAGLRHAIVAVEATGDTVRRPGVDEDGKPLPLVTSVTLGPVPGLGRQQRRAFSVGDLRFRSQARPTPGSVARFWVEPPAGSALTCTTVLPGDPKDGGRASVPPGLGLVGVLTCAIDDLRGDRPTIPGTLTVLVRDHSLTGPEIEARLQAAFAVEELRRNLAETGSGSPGDSDRSDDDPFGSTTPSTSTSDESLWDD